MKIKLIELMKDSGISKKVANIIVHELTQEEQMKEMYDYIMMYKELKAEKTITDHQMIQKMAEIIMD